MASINESLRDIRRTFEQTDAPRTHHSDSDSNLDSESDDDDDDPDIRRLKKQTRRLAENEAGERERAPEKVPLKPWSEVIQEIESERKLLPKGGCDVVRQSFVATRPSFCESPIGKMQKIMLRDLFLRKLHKGRFLLCRIISKTTQNVAVDFAVEDPAGDAIQVSVYNYPCTLDASLDETDALFPIGAVLAVREPYYKVTEDALSRVVRIDSPSDLVFVDSNDEILKDVKWTTGATVSSASRRLTSAESWKERGGSEFKAKRWLSAATCYSEALKLNPSHILSRLNRAEAYLRLEWFNSALNDCKEALKCGLTDDSLVRKAVFRAAKASYYLGDYAYTLEVTDTRPDDTDCVTWREKAKQRIHEKTTGQYDWCSLFIQAQKDAARIDAAEYIGPIEVRQSGEQDATRGTYATRDIAAGELLMVTKPMAIVYPEDLPDTGKGIFWSVDLTTDKKTGYIQTALVHKLVQNVWDSCEQADMLKSMYAGPSLPQPLNVKSSHPPPTPLAHARQPVIDIDVARICAVVTKNAFGTEGDPIS